MSSAKEAVIEAKIEAVELGSKHDVLDLVLLLGEQIVRAESEEADLVPRRQVPGDPRLVVAIVEGQRRRDEGEQRAGVRVAPAHERGSTPVGKAALDQGAGVEDAEVALAVEIVARRGGLGGHDGSGVAAILRRVAARMEIHALHQRRVDNRGPDEDVE